MKPYINLSISIAIIWKDFCPMKKKNPQLTDASNEERIFLIRKLEGRKEFCMVGVVISEGNSSTRRKNIRHEREKRVEWEIREKKNLGSSTFECVAISTHQHPCVLIIRESSGIVHIDHRSSPTI